MSAAPASGTARKRHSSQNPACSDSASGTEPRQDRRQRVGVQQRVGRRPPAQVADGEPVERDQKRQVDADDQVPRDRLAQHRPRAGAVLRPDAPELQVLGESAPRQALGGHERQREDAGERQERGDLRRHLLDREAGLGQRGVVAHPQQRPLIESGQKLRKGDRRAPDERHAPQHPPLAEQHEQPDADAADPVEQEHREAAADGDALVGRAHLLVAAVEGLGYLQQMGQLGQPVAADDQAQAEAALAGVYVGPLVDERVVDPPARALLLGRLHRLVAVERDVPGFAGPVLRDAAGRVGVEHGARIVLRQPLAESVGRPVRTEAHLHLAAPSPPRK